MCVTHIRDRSCRRPRHAPPAYAQFVPMEEDSAMRIGVSGASGCARADGRGRARAARCRARRRGDQPDAGGNAGGGGAAGRLRPAGDAARRVCRAGPAPADPEPRPAAGRDPPADRGGDRRRGRERRRSCRARLGIRHAHGVRICRPLVGGAAPDPQRRRRLDDRTSELLRGDLRRDGRDEPGHGHAARPVGEPRRVHREGGRRGGACRRAPRGGSGSA